MITKKLGSNTARVANPDLYKNLMLSCIPLQIGKDVHPLFCDRNWELLAAWQGAKVTIPTKFIVGDKDTGFECNGTREYVTGDVFKRYVPNLEVVILDGHHFIQQERAQEVSDEILSFLRK